MPGPVLGMWTDGFGTAPCCEGPEEVSAPAWVEEEEEGPKAPLARPVLGDAGQCSRSHTVPALEQLRPWGDVLTCRHQPEGWEVCQSGSGSSRIPEEGVCSRGGCTGKRHVLGDREEELAKRTIGLLGG